MLPPWTERHQLGAKRIRNILRSLTVANARTLEQKISDAGPSPQRVQPHVLTISRQHLETAGVVSVRHTNIMPWYHLTSTDRDQVEARLAVLLPIQRKAQLVSQRVGQSLEISVLRALRSQSELEFFGDFPDLNEHDDSTLYSKEEPPAAISGRRIPGDKKLDFLVRHPEAGYAGIEAKNIREWLYPDRIEIREVLLKCCALDAVPVLIARRIAYPTFRILQPCGVVIHQTFNQIYPDSAVEIATQLRDKRLMGYHDIRLIGAEDAAITHARLSKFLGENLPNVLPEARESFEEFKDLLGAYATEQYDYKAFAARVLHRLRGESEDFPGADVPPEFYE
jgi:hypothetical protein